MWVAAYIICGFIFAAVVHVVSIRSSDPENHIDINKPLEAFALFSISSVWPLSLLLCLLFYIVTKAFKRIVKTVEGLMSFYDDICKMRSDEVRQDKVIDLREQGKGREN
jgi:hypothetical protein